jgi:hypothetical protein
MAGQPRDFGSTPGSANTFLRLRSAQTGSRSQPTTYHRHRRLLSHASRSGPKADLLPPPSFEFKTQWGYACTSYTPSWGAERLNYFTV